MYLHEIGRVHLLTAKEEKDLARKMEEGRRIKDIKQDYLQRYGREPYASEIIITILKELSQAAPVIQLLQEQLQLARAAIEAIDAEGLVEVIAESDDRLLEKYLEGTKLSPEELESGLAQAVIKRKVFPVLMGSALTDKGIPEANIRFSRDCLLPAIKSISFCEI